ncbi:MAG TPA: polysaccharide biosynthesis/export family protein, partial [Nitrococcus sp.]|nr:polysaccharide biosynthesis/export family protein [Nitrococcus sp.]
MDVVVWGNPDVSRTIIVPPDGRISTPLVEDVPATGKTSTELARDLEKALSRYIKQPVVTVILKGFVGPYSRQIRVVGEAAKPQAMQY